jgi:hypothetical protein
VNASGFVDDDSPYGKQDDKGTYYFEFSRPLRTMDQFQQVFIYYLSHYFSHYYMKISVARHMCTKEVTWSDIFMSSLFCSFDN